MTKNYDTSIKELVRILDFFIIFFSFYLAFHVRNSEFFIPFVNKTFGGLLPYPATFNHPLSNYERFLWFIVPLWFFLLTYWNSQFLSRTGTYFAIFGELLKTHFIGGFAVSGILLITYAEDYKRSFFLLFILISLLLTTAIRFFFKGALEFFRAKGKIDNRAIIVGNSETISKLLSEVKSHPYFGINFIGLIRTEEAGLEEGFNLPILGKVDDLMEILRSKPIDDVFVASDENIIRNIKSIIKTCEAIGVNVHLIPDKLDLEIARSTIGKLGNLEFISFSTIREKTAQRMVKVIMDYLISFFLLPFYLTVFAIVGILIKIDSPGPVLYKSIRLTRNRRPFILYKFRTMKLNAEEEEEALAKKNEMEGPILKIKDDPRITGLGKFLRKYSIDELPQIINVLNGDLSLVGPRPPTPKETEKYEFHQLRKLSMLQGITGLWQVEGRDEITSFNERLKLDLEYIDNWNLLLDFKILIKTFRVVFRGAM